MATGDIKKERLVESICRLCLTEREHSESIFGNENDSLSNWIESLTSLKIVSHPNAPASLCSECKIILENFNSFREMCITNDMVFKELYIWDDEAESLEFIAIQNDNMVDYDENEKNILIKSAEPIDFNIEYLEDETEMSAAVQDVKIETDVKICGNVEQYEELAKQKRIRKRAHLAETRKKLCPICNTRVSALGSHLLTHKEYKPFQCEYCSMTFNMKCNLTKHIRRHLQLKNYICSYCEKGFTNTAELKIHVRIHTNEKPYSCKQCDKAFKTGGVLNRHVQSIHQKLRPHTCEVCQAKFTLGAHLRRHRLRHTLERPYGCSVCHRNYARKDLLKVHVCRA